MEDPLHKALAEPAPAEPPPPNELALADEPKNDLGNARRLIARHGEDLRFVAELAKHAPDAWLVWDGQSWRGRAWDAALRKAHETGEAVEQEAVALRAALEPLIEKALQEEDKGRARALEERIEKHFKWRISCGNAARAQAMLATAAPYLVISNKELDADPLLLAVENGTLILPPDGQGDLLLRAGRREDFITRRCQAAYDPEARAPKFQAFLETILPSAAVRRFLQRWFGYCLTGLTGEQLVVMFHGQGGNGKSTLLNIIRGVLGGYALTLPFHSFVHDDRKRGGDATPDLVRLPGARLVTAAEPEVGVRLSEATIKTQTGGEPMAVRPLYQDTFDFTPTHKPVLSFNPKPKIVAQDEGTWRRIALVHFGVRLSGPKPKPAFDVQVLREEAAGVLNWLLDGYRLWAEGGLAVPEEVSAATLEYRTESDPLAEFIASLVLHRKGQVTRANVLYEAYQVWAKANATEPVSATRFGRLMPEKGFVKERVGGVVYYYDTDLNHAELDALRGGGHGGGAEPPPPDDPGEGPW